MPAMQYPEIPRLLTEKCSARIHLATIRKIRTAFQLSKDLGIPIATCYRKIKQLEESGLIVCVERMLTRDGREVGLFRSSLSDAHILFEMRKFQAHIDMFDGSTQVVSYEIDLPSFWEAPRQTV
jgi:predicted ArsR family transcriptional regulator